MAYRKDCFCRQQRIVSYGTINEVTIATSQFQCPLGNDRCLQFHLE